MSSKRAPPAPPTTIDDLDDGLLLRVLARVPPPARRRLPLVCRRWRRVCGNPTEELDSEVYLNFSSGAIEHSGAMYRWLLLRRDVIRALTIVAETDEDWQSIHLVLGLVAGRLERLSVRGGREGLGMHSVAWLAVLRSLKALSLDFEDEDVILTAALPPGLESLTLRPRRFAELSALPEALASLGGSLRELSLRAFNQTGWVPVLYHAHFVFDADDPNDPGEGGVDEVRPENPLEALCALTQLERLTIRSSKLRMLPAGMAALASSLTRLVLSDCFESPMPPLHRHQPTMFEAKLDPLAGLTSLASLDLSGCGLGELPPEVAVLPMLRTLLLADNDLTALPGGLYLDSLESLDCGMNMLASVPPALMSCRRLQQLDLSSRQHSGDGAKLKFSAKDLRVLLKNNPGLRTLSISSEAGIGAAQLAALCSSFPRVHIAEVDPSGGREGTESSERDDSDFRLGYASTGSEEEDGDWEGEDSGSSSSEDGDDEGQEGSDYPDSDEAGEAEGGSSSSSGRGGGGSEEEG